MTKAIVHWPPPPFLTNLWNTLQHWNMFYPHVQESLEHQVVLQGTMLLKALVTNSASLFQNSSNVTASQTTEICVSKTFILDNGRSTHFEPCESLLSVDTKSEPLFKKTSSDETIGLSIEDKRFIEVMESKFAKDSTGRWTAPLPFRLNRPPLANNREQALKRANSFDLSLKRDPNKQQHTLEFMQKMFNNGHAEIAFPVDEKTEHWYLPLFSIYHPKKPDSVRVVFDSAVKFHGSSLNDVLIK